MHKTARGKLSRDIEKECNECVRKNLTWQELPIQLKQVNNSFVFFFGLVLYFFFLRHAGLFLSLSHLFSTEFFSHYIETTSTKQFNSMSFLIVNSWIAWIYSFICILVDSVQNLFTKLVCGCCLLQKQKFAFIYGNLRRTDTILRIVESLNLSFKHMQFIMHSVSVEHYYCDIGQA